VGVTLHFEGRLNNADSLRRVISDAMAFAACEGWTTSAVHEVSVTLRRVQNERDIEYRGPVEGVVVFPHSDAEPLRLEFDRTLYVQDWIKTQFAPVDIHVRIVELLRSLKSEFEWFRVDDEGEYWETSDLQCLTEHVATVNKVLRDLLVKDPGKRGPVHLPSGRIVDYMS